MAVTFDSQTVISVDANGARSVFAADLDRDGDLDLLSASRSDNKIAWYENTGGTFGPQQIISTNTNSAESVYAVDIDSDGNIDVLSASRFDDRIAWYRNLGNGSFGLQQTISTSADDAREVFAADIDNDGDLDVLSASFADDEIAWYPNNGFGIFGAQQLISNSADGAQSVYAADLDNDGDLDVLSASENDDKIAWYENNGNGIFGGVEDIISSSADGAQSVFAADLDRDGDLDVLSASFSDEKIAWYENNGGGTFGAQQIISSNADGAGSVYATDLDNDGDLDVISASENDDKIAWYENNGSGSFGTEQVISTAANGVRSVVAADLDNDGDRDIFSASQIDNKIAWYQNTTPGVVLSPSTETTVSTTANSARSVYAADLDNDGDLDLLSASFNDDKIAWYENVGGGSFGGEQIISSNADGAIYVYAADLDNDGDLDVLSASFSDNKIAWYKNGGGSFGNQQVISTDANGPSSVFAADIDSDGDLDLLSASSIDDRIAGFENLGGGSFSSINVISNSADNAQAVYAADLDNDGDLDILSASRDDNKIAWYRHLDGAGTFGAEQIISTALSGARSVYAADLDNDGDLDVVAAGLLGDRIVWYENNGSGSFGAQQIISTTADNPESVYAADIDNDGDLDVVAGSSADDKVAWYENNGSGSFGSEIVISRNAEAPFSVYAADLDNDGDLDVLSASIGDDKIAWYENAPVTRIVSSGSPGEAGAASGTFTFSRGSATQGNVTIAFTVGGSATTGDDYTAVGADTFTAGSGTVTIPDGSRTVNITIVPVDDSVIDASETVELALVDGSGYTVSTVSNSANLAIADNDSAGITITQSGGNTNVTEGGATDTYDISLDTIPSNPVTISIAPDTQTDLGAGAGTAIALNFAADATALTPQTVTVTATDDAIAEGSHLSTIGHSVVSADVNYNGFSLANIGATITDNDSPGVSISESGGNINLTEGGASDSYDLVLTTQPSADVTINLATAGQVTTSSNSLTFTSANWNQPQTVTVVAINDALAEGNHTGTISHSSSSTDPNYNGIAIANLLANITDDDSAGISIAVSGGSTEVSEGGNTDTYTIVLTSAPTAPVTVSFNPGSDLESIAPLTFDPTNWNVAQTVTVRATDDRVAEGNHNSTIAHRATSTDLNYSGIAIASVSVQIADNDNAGVSIIQTEGSTQIAEGGTTDTYSVVLTTAPTAPVTIRFNTDSQVEAIADLTFTPNNWNVSQTVTVTAREDSIDESLHSSTISHQSLSLDSNYNEIAIGNVFVAIADNDAATPGQPNPQQPNPQQPNPQQPNPEQPLQSPFPPSLPVVQIVEAEVPAGVIVTEPAGSMELFEGIGTELYKVRLFSQPTEDVAIAITTDGQISTDIQTLTFTSSNWQIPQTVTVVAADDSVNEGSHSGGLIHTASSGDRRYDQIAIDNIVANIVDNDNLEAENNLATSSILRFSESNDRVIGSPARDVIHGGAGNDYLDGAEGDDFIFGQLGNDVSLGREGDDQIAGNEGNDYLQGNLGSDRISGGAGNDRVRGGSGDDLLFGDSGSDRLFGDRGADTLLGGLGNDAFAIGSGTGGQTLDRADVIADFTKSQDTILLTGALTFDRLSIFPGSGANANSSIIRDLATGEYLAILQSVRVDNLDSGDFV
ncbi:MAG: hypothetical protein F6J93_21145 [Oscillatoria sp. SIO1A7]|nr:hypothetical protein [Oscillatoria sp. SIO1A7]